MIFFLSWSPEISSERSIVAAMAGNNQDSDCGSWDKKPVSRGLRVHWLAFAKTFCHEEMRPNENELVADRLISKICPIHRAKFPGYLSIHGSRCQRFTIGLRTSRVRDRSLEQQSRWATGGRVEATDKPP
jgi:hypothetical protein